MRTLNLPFFRLERARGFGWRNVPWVLRAAVASHADDPQGCRALMELAGLGPEAVVASVVCLLESGDIRWEETLPGFEALVRGLRGA